MLWASREKLSDERVDAAEPTNPTPDPDPDPDGEFLLPTNGNDGLGREEEPAG